MRNRVSIAANVELAVKQGSNQPQDRDRTLEDCSRAVAQGLVSLPGLPSALALDGGFPRVGATFR
jgi:hypothetical protein